MVAVYTLRESTLLKLLKKQRGTRTLPITLNLILREAGLPLSDVCLLRHQDNRAKRGTSYELWRDNRPAFDLYQSHQQTGRRQKFSKSHWASFVGTPYNETLFVGLYEAKYKGLLDHDRQKVHMDGMIRQALAKSTTSPW